MKQNWGFKLWQVLYPVGIYYVVSSLCYFGLAMIMGEATETYMQRQLTCATVTIPFIYSFYRQDKMAKQAVYGKQEFHPDKQQIFNILLSVVAAAALGMAVNNVLAMTPLMQQSAGFQSANEAFFGGSIAFELLGSCLMIPIAEELLFRGVVYGRLKLYIGGRAALIGSALLFGIFHVNLVQFLYAALLGLLLAVLVEWTGYLYPAILGHIAANMAAVVRAHTDLFRVSSSLSVSGVAVTLVLALLGAGAVFLLWKNNSDTI